LTAYSAFAAAVLESRTRVAHNVKTIVHTGPWGAGHAAGNAVLMCMLQILAAKMSLVDEIVYHNIDATKAQQFNEAMDIIQKHFSESMPLDKLISTIVDLGFKWGVSDGN